MATTIVRKYTEPVVLTTEQIRALAQDWLESARGDEDKTDDVEDASYYAGWADAMEELLRRMIGVYDAPEQADGEDSQ